MESDGRTRAPFGRDASTASSLTKTQLASATSTKAKMSEPGQQKGALMVLPTLEETFERSQRCHENRIHPWRELEER